MAFRIGSFEFFIEAATQFSFFEVDHIKHSAIDREVWAFGCHLVISRLESLKA
jgi:hypothetical protein